MNPELIKEVNRLFHDLEADEYDSKHVEIMEGDRTWWNYLGSRYIANFARSSDTSVAMLDVGCGTGFVGDILLRYLHAGDTYIGYDYSRKMLTRAVTKCGNSSPQKKRGYAIGDAERLPFKDSSFHIVTVNAVLHHLPHYEQCLKEIDRVLHTGGLLVVAHEQNLLFFKSWLFSALAVLYKLIGGAMKISDDIQHKLNQQLTKKGLIVKDLSKDEIMRLVDFHSPIEQHAILIDRRKGFDPRAMIDTYFHKYSLLELNEYSTFFYRPFLKKRRILHTIFKLFNTIVLRNKGPLFRFVIKK